jgi:hypothetical protein
MLTLRSRSAPLRETASVAALVLLAGGGAVLSGLFVTFASVTGAALIFGACALIAALVLPLKWLLMLMMIVVYLVAGPAQYFGGITRMFWVPYLMGVVLYLRIGLHLLGSPPRFGAIPGQIRTPPGPVPGGAMLPLYLLFLASALASSAINGTKPVLLFTASKEYLFLTGVLFVFALGMAGLRHIEVALRWVPWFLILQLPAAIYQRFVIATGRVGRSPWDAVVGLFPGDPMGGGASGTMALFTVTSLVLLTEGWRAGRISGRRTLVAAVFGIAAVALAEVKIALILIPIMGLLVFSNQLLRRPFQSLAMMLLSVGLGVALTVLYQQQFTSNPNLRGQTVQEYARLMIERNIETPRFVGREGQMGRVSSITFWASQQSDELTTSTLIGHGIGATRIGDLAAGDLVKKFWLPIGRSSLVIALWETGVVGAGFLVAAMLSGGIAAWRLSKRRELQEHAWLLRGVAWGLLIVALTLPYGADFLTVAQMQVLGFLLMGAVLAARRTVKLGPPGAAAPA